MSADNVSSLVRNVFADIRTESTDTVFAYAGKPAYEIIESGVENGIEWETRRAPLYGAVNGYAHIPVGHPWHGLDYDEIDVRVHGGLTFGDGEWIGFDTLHYGDYWPEIPYGLDASDIEWTPAMVAEQTRRLARQVAEAAR